MSNEGENSVKVISLFLENFRSDILYLSETPPIQGIIRAREGKGIDSQDQSTYQEWVSRLNIIFTSFLKNRPYYDQIRYIDENGNEMVRVNIVNGQVQIVPTSELQKKAYSEFFRETMALQRGEIYVSPINLSRGNNQEIEVPYKPVIRYAIPIYNPAGEKKGILVANILVERLFELVDNQNLKSEYEQQFFVVNSQGYYLNHPNTEKNWGFELGHNETLSKDYPSEIVQKILSDTSGIITNSPNYILSYNTIFPDPKYKENPFTLVYKTPKKVVLKPVDDFISVATIVTLITGVIFLVFGIILFRKLVNSILEVVGVVSEFVSQVFLMINEQERIANQQLSSVQETTVTMDELNISSQQSAQQAEAAVAGAKQALNQVEQGNKAVKQALEEMEILKAKVEAIAQKIIRLSEQTHQIGSISDVVSDLSNQTNMLALNASVEAVRAGEYGKGFAVVASEIRKLSDASQKSSQKINTLVNDIQHMIQSTVLVAEEGTKNVESGVKTSHQTAQVFFEVSKSMEQIVDSSKQIALMSKQQALATQQVNQAMNNLTKGANETAQGINQIKVGSEKLNDAANNLKNVL
ncbi:methyl-accepting chemotaxis protein [Capilliphycus salinus ALCB114379]|uniref:methyl-accepting chemotaxis protein n=1 Tax=Capilliphycus salinus TaxID=2768948 RepID=UPI0039A445DA